MLSLILTVALGQCRGGNCAVQYRRQPVAYYYVQQQSAYYQVQAQPQPQQAAPVAPQAVGSDAAGFLAWLNAVRAQHGLQAVGYDAGLEAWCHQNNLAQAAQGMGHWIMGAARRQNAGWGHPSVIYPAWMNSPGHRSALLDPTIRNVGIAYHGDYITFNAN